MKGGYGEGYIGPPGIVEGGMPGVIYGVKFYPSPGPPTDPYLICKPKPPPDGNKLY